MGKRKLKTEFIIIIAAAIIRLILYQAALFNSGYHGDELLHIDAGNHLAFGYMDFPPMIGFLAWIQNLFQSDSIFIHHLFVSIAGVTIIIFAGLITMKLGGKWLAVLMTLSCIIFSPGFSGNHFAPTIFEGMFWIICMYFIVLYCNQANDRYFLLIALFAAFGFLSKYSIVFQFAGLILSILLFRRDILKKKWFWLSFLAILIIISPNLWWQYNNHFPVFRHISNLYDTQLDHISFIKELKTFVIFLNPVIIVFVLTGLIIIPFHKNFKKYRLLSFALLFSFVLLFIAKGKYYYFFLIAGGLIPFTTVYFENLLWNKKWIIYSYLAILFIEGSIFIPHVLPILKLEKYIAWYGLKPNEDNKIPLIFSNYYSHTIWPQILESTQKTYKGLTPLEQKKCLVWGRHYSHAGGINLFKKKYDLPLAFSFHSSYYVWVPDFSKDITVIAIGEANWTKQHYEQYFEEVEEIDVIQNPYATKPNWYNHNIFLCRKSKYDSAELKELFKDEIY